MAGLALSRVSNLTQMLNMNAQNSAETETAMQAVERVGETCLIESEEMTEVNENELNTKIERKNDGHSDLDSSSQKGNSRKRYKGFTKFHDERENENENHGNENENENELKSISKVLIKIPKPQGWPFKGEIEFKNVEMRYRKFEDSFLRIILHSETYPLFSKEYHLK